MGYSLQDFHDAAEKKFRGLAFDDLGFTLRSTLRIPEGPESDEVDRIEAELSALNETEATVGANKEAKKLMVDLLVAVADDHEKAREAFSSLDMAVIMTIFQEYSKVSQSAVEK